jgi:glyoxylase-like metal-dependent hydrolase (beta-lactamase superfamily II)
VLVIGFVATWVGGGVALTANAEQVSEHLQFSPGAVNSVLLTDGDHGLAVYGWSGAAVEQVLLTHGRRDVAWAAESAIKGGAKAIAPRRAEYHLAQSAEHWKAFVKGQFHDYAQQSTKIRLDPLPVAKWVSDGDVVAWRGVELRVLETPGFTRGSVSYLAAIDGKRVAFTGDLVYGDGQVMDLYSFQDAIPEAQVRGYHGYGSRLAALVGSLDKMSAAKPDIIIPARGPIIRNPLQSMAKLKRRVQNIYRNYLSTNALHWYFKEQRMKTCGARVLGKDAEIELMPYSKHVKTPEWVFEQSTSRLLISNDRRGFLLDCGNQRVLDTIKKLITDGIIEKVEGIFVTHYHDDHTDAVQAAAEEFKCPVYATAEYADVLERPHAYHLPAMTANPIRDVTVVGDGETKKWRDFELTFHFFPGQTFYHGALFAEKKGHKPIFFIGDAFAPSGIDDYCVLNRNLLHDDEGYLRCLSTLRAQATDFWLVNEHIQYVFSFDKSEMSYLESRYRERIRAIAELVPFDDPNYAVDEQWAVFYPYTTNLAAEAVGEVELRITNHSNRERTYRVTPRAEGGAQVSERPTSIRVAAGEVGGVKVKFTASKDAGNALITADIQSDGIDVRRWSEALIIAR